MTLESSSFFGRATELDDLANYLRVYRLVTIVGLGGIGKTRLATHYAAVASPQYSHGAYVVSLKDVTDSSAIPSAAATALGLEAGPQQAIGRILTYLRNAQALLVIDNAEHLLSGVKAFIVELLDAAPHVSAIVTSREPLHLDREAVLRLGGIDDGVRLFVDRAYAPDQAEALSPETRTAIAAVCSALQGIPLAIELAAARAAALPPEEFVRTVDAPALGSSVLQQTLDWSYRLLDPAEQRCFAAISLFEGTFSRESAAAIFTFGDHDADFALRSLTAKSLLVRSDASDVVEYYLLEAIREYAQRRLRDDPAADAVESAYVEHYMQFIESLTSEGVGIDRMVHVLGREWPNVQSALHRAMERDDSARDAYGVLPRTWRFWAASGRAVEGLHWFTQALKRQELSHEERLALLDAAARMAANALNYAELEPLARELVTERERRNDPKALGDALFMLASAVDAVGRHDEAASLYRRALEQFDASGFRRGKALVLGTQGIAMGQRSSSQKGLSEALDLLERALQVFRDEDGLSLSCAEALENLAVVSRRAGHLEQAMAYAEEALRLYQRLGNVVRAAAAHTTIADVCIDLGHSLQAISVLQAGRRAIRGEYRPLFNAYTAEAAFKAAVDLRAFEIAAKLYGFAAEYRRLIRIPLPGGEQEDLNARYNAMALAMESSHLARCLAEGERMEPEDVDAVLSLLKRSEDVSPARRKHIVRGRLNIRIDRAASYRAVFLTAGGAWGKTVAVEQYFAEKPRSTVKLELDSSVNVDTFVSRLLGALAANSKMQAPADNFKTATPAASILSKLAGFRGSIVIDDFHFADAATEQLLFELISKTTHVQWFVLSRRNGQAPIGSCMAYGLAGPAIEDRDLAFTLDEVAELAQKLQLRVTRDECSDVAGFTDGWPLAVDLALNKYISAVAMAPLERRNTVERETVSAAAAYLREQAFRDLLPAQQRLLLTAGAMPGDIGLTVLREFHDGTELAMSLLRNSVPMWQVTEGAYRLPYLWKRFLQIELELSPDRQAIYRALAEAYERVGDASSAIKVLLTIERYESVIRLLLEHAEAWVNADWPDLLETLLSRIPMQLLRSEPALLLARAVIDDRRNRFGQAMQLLEQAQTSSDVNIVLRVACARAALCINNDCPASSELLERVLDRGEYDPTMMLRAKALLCCAYLDEEKVDASKALLETIRSSVRSLVAYERNVDVLYWTALAHYRTGDYAVARELASRIVTGHAQEPWLVVAQAHALLSMIAVETAAAFSEVVRHNGDAIVAAQKLSNVRLYAGYLRRRCMLLLHQGDVDLTDLAMNRPDTQGTQLGTAYTSIYRFLTALQDGERRPSVEKATEAYVEAAAVGKTMASDPILSGDPLILKAYALMAACLANDPAAKTLAGELNASLDETALSTARERPMVLRHKEIARYASLVCEMFWGQHQQLGNVARALEAKSGDVIADAAGAIAQSIVFASRKPAAQRDVTTLPPDAVAVLRGNGYGTVALLLTALDRKARTLAAVGVALTPVETQILRLMAEGHSASEIATARHNSLNTIQTHQKAIYRKLGVRSAAAAIGRGRSLGLL